MTNKKRYHTHNKNEPKSQSMKNDRQAMSPPDWSATRAFLDRPKTPDPEPRQLDGDYQENGQDVGKLGNDDVKKEERRNFVNSGRKEDGPLPFSQEDGETIHTPYGTFTKNREGILQLDGFHEEDQKRSSAGSFAVSHPSDPVHYATAVEGPPVPSSSSGPPHPHIHPSRASLHQQSLIARIVERLRDEEGLSPQAIADLLKRGAHLLPPEAQTDLALAASGLVQLPVPLGYRVSIEPSVIGTEPTAIAIDATLKDPQQIAESLKTTTLEPKPSTAEMSQTKILIPRSAGIKIRGIFPEPPLVDAPAPDKSKIVVSAQYLFQHSLESAGLMDERDVQGRLQGIAIIEATRRNLRMPMKTYGTACVFFMRYRYHVATKGAEDEEVRKYDFRDAALASLWLASKAEETPKKSKEILCAFRNTTLPPEEHLTPDDEIFENQAKLMIHLERYLLEIVAFDFRARNCAELLAGLMVELGSEEKVVRTAMAVALDLYRTLAVLKQTRQTLALACVEMASRFVQADDAGKVTSEELYKRVGTTRQEVLETMFDLIELYLNHHAITAAGSRYNINDFMRLSTALRTEMKAKGFNRYTYIQEAPPGTSPIISPPHTDARSTPTLMGTPSTPVNREKDTKKKSPPKDSDKILVDEKDIELGKPLSPPPAHLLASPGRTNGHSSHSPTSPTSPTSAEAPNPDDPSQVREVVRFVLDASRARDEDLLRRPYHNIETVTLTEEHLLYIPKDGSSEQAELELATKGPAPKEDKIVPPTGPGKMRNENANADVEMRDVPPSGPRGMPPLGPRELPPLGPRGDRERERERRRSPPPVRPYGRDDRYRRDDRRW